MNLSKADLLSIVGVEIWTKESHLGTEQVYTYIAPNGQTYRAKSVAMFIKQLVQIGVLEEKKSLIVPPVHIQQPYQPTYTKVKPYKVGINGK